MRVLKDDENLENDPFARSLPKPIFDLTTDQLILYRKIGRDLVKARKFKPRFAAALTYMACEMDKYLQAEKRIRELGYDDGLVQIFKSGAANISPHVTLQNHALKNISHFFREFGMGEKSDKQIAKIANQGSLFSDDGFDNFVSNKAG
jgi:phage terminase small subunit